MAGFAHRLAKFTFVAIGLALGLSAPVIAQDAEVTEARVDDVIVTGRALADRVDHFVDTVTAPPPGRGPARWNDRTGICVGVVNLSPDLAQAIADRVSDVARGIGIPSGEPGCRSNVTVIATDDAGALAVALVQRSPNAFRPRYSGAAHSADALRRFQQDLRPVRWWHVVMPVTADTGQVAVRLPGDDPEKPRYISSPGGMRTGVRNHLVRAHIILDMPEIVGLNAVQIADYVAMVALAQINPETTAEGFDSILNVFDDPTQVAQMTDWDRAYLTGLYDAELNARNTNAQRSAVSRTMLRDRREASIDSVPTP